MGSLLVKQRRAGGSGANLSMCARRKEGDRLAPGPGSSGMASQVTCGRHHLFLRLHSPPTSAHPEEFQSERADWQLRVERGGVDKILRSHSHTLNGPPHTLSHDIISTRVPFGKCLVSQHV